MDFDEYVAARHGTLLRAAVLMGCAETAAPNVVDRVLARSARKIRRSEDPDPAVLAALVGAIPGAAATPFGASTSAELRDELLMAAPAVDSRPGGPIAVPPARLNNPVLGVLAVLVALLVAAGMAGSGHPEPRLPLTAGQVPSLFGYDAQDARALLSDRGLTVVEQPVRACELPGRVVGTDPPIGAPLSRGDTITIRTAVPSDVFCMARYADRALAWRFLDFATGRGPAPDFARLVRVVVDRSEPAILAHERAVERASWDGLSAPTELAAAAREVRAVGSGYRAPQLTVTSGTPPLTTCGIRRPILSGERPAVSITIAIPGDAGTCSVRVDLYQAYDAIDAVVLYTRKQDQR
ncbi:MAG: hypothetical protein JWO11_1107 [Nocardioides sp.]|nr:hypothetical protein [Nocardioides sp.]